MLDIVVLYYVLVNNIGCRYNTYIFREFSNIFQFLKAKVEVITIIVYNIDIAIYVEVAIDRHCDIRLFIREII